MLEVLNTYDWGEVFGCSGESGMENNCQPEKCIPSEDVSISPITREDVRAIYWILEGENDEANWLIGGEANDGRFFFTEAGCDYTGWDCRSGGTCRVSASVAVLVRFGMTDDARRRLGIEVAAKLNAAEANHG